MSGSDAGIYPDEWELPKEGGNFERVIEILFGARSMDLYGVLDGASDPNNIYKSIVQSREEFRCLYRGELDDDLRLCAPFIVHFKKPGSITLNLIKAIFEKNAGILVWLDAGTDIDLVRRHFRRFLLVQTPEKKTVYFRYYDPRVLGVYLPTCNGKELRTLFGQHVRRYFVPTGKGFGVRVFNSVLQEETA